MNNKAYSETILTAATAAIAAAGGVTVIDRLPEQKRLPVLRGLYKTVAEATGCHLTTAKRSVIRAMRNGRCPETLRQWGGARPGAGRPKNSY